MAVAAILGTAAAAASLLFALTLSDAATIQIFLLEWIAAPYLVAGSIAWWCRPDSRLGALMVAGGIASAFSGWQYAMHGVPYTLGAAFDIVPAALFLHVSLAFPDGKLSSRFERALVAVAYVAGVGLQVVKLTLDGVGPGNLIAISAQTGLVQRVEDVQLLTLAGACLTGVALVYHRRRRVGRPRRRSVAVVVDSFALGLVMVAVLFTIGAFDWPGFREVQRVTLFAFGLAPLAFLLGLLDVRLARSSVGELVLELRGEPAPQGLRDALSLRLSLLERRLPAEPHAREELDAARREIALSLDELRDVARGIHPAVLSGHGLAVAVESLAAHAPLPVRLAIAVAGRLPDRVEVAAYYVVAESLANVAKHAQAGQASVSLDRRSDRLVVEVVDDGVGGADTERGSGLRGLADRVESLGGRLRVWTPLGGGTRVQAEIPCA